MKRALLTWSDAGIAGPRPAHHAARPADDRGPVLRLLDQAESRYDAVWVLTIPAGEGPTARLAKEIERLGPTAAVRTVHVTDPSDHAALFHELGPLASDARRAFPAPEWSLDVCLSAGTPQAQTLWVILVQAGVLPARMLQVIPAVFVDKGRPPVRVVRLDFEGFPEIRALRREVLRLRAEVRPAIRPLLGESPSIVEMRRRIERVARSDAPVLILGETGTGKELVARSIHEQSTRAKGPFVAENCGVFAEGVLASELFGHEAGAFTGASTRRKGVFEQAHNGTLLLDEVGELSPRVQAALLRVLQEGALRRVGGEVKVPVDVRVLAATHRDLQAMVRAGTFREDLYFRLRGATIEVPPLRARPGDIEVLMDAFLDEVAVRRAAGRLQLTREARRAVLAYPWPGNVRELRAEVERWAVFCDAVIDVADLTREIVDPSLWRVDKPAAADKPGAADNPVSSTGKSPESSPASERGPVRPLTHVVEEAKKKAIMDALRATDKNLSRAARLLKIDRNTLRRSMDSFRLPRGAKES